MQDVVRDDTLEIASTVLNGKVGTIGLVRGRLVGVVLFVGPARDRLAASGRNPFLM